MKALRFHAFGNPADVLQIDDVPAPELAADEVLVRLTARSVNPSDLYTIMGTYGLRPRLPAVGGNEAAGIVAQVGSAVDTVQVGDRVTLMLGAVGTEGTWREYVAVKPHWLLPTPANLSDAQAASAWANYLTAWILAFEELKLEPQEPVLVSACASHLGRALLQLAQHAGFEVVGTVRRPEQRQELLELGAAGVIVPGTESIKDRWREITGRKGVAKALDAVGGEVGSEMIASMTQGGTFILYGLLSQQPLQIDGSLIFSEAVIRGFWLVRWLQNTPPATIMQLVQELNELFAAGTLQSPIDSTFDLHEFPAMLERMQTPGRQGKVVLTSPAED